MRRCGGFISGSSRLRANEERSDERASNWNYAWQHVIHWYRVAAPEGWTLRQYGPLQHNKIACNRLCIGIERYSVVDVVQLVEQVVYQVGNVHFGRRISTLF